MTYDLHGLSLRELLAPLVRAEDQLARLDERVRRGEPGSGFVERAHFHDAVAQLWLEGELVHVEDLVLHDAMMDTRSPTHELTRAHAVLRTRRRIFGQPAAWALSQAGLAALTARESATGGKPLRPMDAAEPATARDADGDEQPDALALQLAEIDAVLARTEQLLEGAGRRDRRGGAGEAAFGGQETAIADDIKPVGRRDVSAGAGGEHSERRSIRNPLIEDTDWDEESRLAEWLSVMEEARDEFPPLLAAALAWDAWERIEPLQNQAWLGNLLVAALLRCCGKTTAHLGGISVGLRLVSRERRRSRDRATRLAAFLEGAAGAAEAGLKELDRLGLARTQMERRLRGKRRNSRLPALIELVLARPMVSAGLIAKELGVTQRAALDLVSELGVRELTGRGRFRAWGVL